MQCDALVVVSAEYNWSIPPSMSNIVDNIPATTFTFKPCAIVTYSAGPIGGWRSGMQLRQLFGAVGCTITQKQMGIPTAKNTLDEAGTPVDEKMTQELQTTLNQLYWLARALKSFSEIEPKPAYAM